MNTRTILSVLLATIWISISEVVRNSFLLHDHWLAHYSGKGLVFPEEPLNGAVWGIWSLGLAIVIAILLRKFSFWYTILLTWINGFILMWLVIGNLGVLPYYILPAAVPLSFVEVWVATIIIRGISR